MCEASADGFKALNELRGNVGLSLTPETATDNISTVRIDDPDFENYLQSEVGFKFSEKIGYSNYFLISRVLHPLMVAPVSPRFDSQFNTFARLIQEHTDFSPDYGSNVLWVLDK